MGGQSFGDHLQQFGARVGSSPRRFGLYGTFEEGSEVSAADAVSLPDSEPECKSLLSQPPLPAYQSSPAQLLCTPEFQDLLTSRCQTQEDVRRIQQQLESYKALPNLLQIWAWANGTSLIGRFLGLWWEDSLLRHAPAIRLIVWAYLADWVYAVTTLGLGGIVSLSMRAFTGQSLGERWAGIHMVHEAWYPIETA
ncbi:hypothetical protein WJX84_002667 [Apatococcus fuscideae]|uniref:Uncharacterized protein n=1 Tax=Apatococcus fuscideae TaxID=2026836 RepID=A0AAW1TCQ3_9CHLO